MLARRQHGNHVIGTRHRIGGRRGHQRPRLRQLLAGRLRQVEYGNAVPRMDKIGGHRPTHIAEADKCNLRHGESLLCD